MEKPKNIEQYPEHIQKMILSKQRKPHDPVAAEARRKRLLELKNLNEKVRQRLQGKD